MTSTAPMPPDSKSATGQPLRVLVIEEHAVNQMVWLHHLRQLGFTTQAVRIGAEASTLMDRFVFDVVVVDLDSSEFDGLDAARTIRARHGELEWPWIIGSAVGLGPVDRDAAMAAGVNDLILKTGRHEDIAGAMALAGAYCPAPHHNGRVVTQAA